METPPLTRQVAEALAHQDKCAANLFDALNDWVEEWPTPSEKAGQNLFDCTMDHRDAKKASKELRAQLEREGLVRPLNNQKDGSHGHPEA